MHDDHTSASQALTWLDRGVRDMLIARLRDGSSPDLAAEQCGVTLQDALNAAPCDAQLAVALAGRDPYAMEERRIAQRSVFLGQLALGMRVADAARTAGVSTSQVHGWADCDPHFGRAYQAVLRYTREFAVPAVRAKLTPRRTAQFFGMLRTGKYSVAKAAMELGITEGAIYARRKRDGQFAQLMREAVAEGQASRGESAGT
ncbi:hypothetical protein [Streptomyces sp. NBC_01363]|uniref:hypothetical protein n=1 Tax=Streptomyces sp. NBC_01363 TaxID=2903840 RepID=UPI00224C98B9|nr:hypothetical protein [Streptomyces sp. NBC_01363]MCX4732737.1 hypothetical protein [Streptomyces sp. NBC_01363]